MPHLRFFIIIIAGFVLCDGTLMIIHICAQSLYTMCGGGAFWGLNNVYKIGRSRFARGMAINIANGACKRTIYGGFICINRHKISCVFCECDAVKNCPSMMNYCGWTFGGCVRRRATWWCNARESWTNYSDFMMEDIYCFVGDYIYYWAMNYWKYSLEISTIRMKWIPTVIIYQ